MTTLADLQAQLAELEKHRAMGVRRVERGENRTEFRSDAELVAAIGDLKGRIAALEGGRITEVRIFSTKGLNT